MDFRIQRMLLLGNEALELPTVLVSLNLMELLSFVKGETTCSGHSFMRLR